MTGGTALGARAVRRLPLWLLLGLLGVLVILPIGMLLYASVLEVEPGPGSFGGGLTLENYRELLTPATYLALWNSLVVAVGGTVVALVLGLSLAWLAARTDVPARWLVQLAGIVPLFVSSMVGALAWSLLASPRQGYLNLILRDLGIPFTINVYTIGGLVFVFGIYYAPYVFLLTYSGLTLINPELEEAARVHCASDRRVATQVTFPLVSPALLGATLLTFALIIENFPVPALLGTPSGLETLPSLIYRLMNLAPPDANGAAALGTFLLVTLMLVVFAQRRMLGRREYTTVTGKGFRPRQIRLGRLRWPAVAFCVTYVVTAIVLPFGALLELSLRENVYVGGAADLFDVSAFGLEGFQVVLGDISFRIGLYNSLVAGLLAAILGGALHFVMALVVHRSKLRGRNLIAYLGMMPVAIPAIVLGLGFLWTWYLLPVPLYGTLLILVLAYVARFTPQSFGSISNSFRQIRSDLEESALVSGAGRSRTSLEITVPLIRSSIVSAMLLLLIFSIRELSAVIFLFTSDTRVLSVVIFDFWESGVFDRAAAVSVLYSVVLAAIALFSRRWLGVRDLSGR
ncbi:MAG: ABC transporter permease subunit [Streptosporangiales bacterium]|nr:ABC transporter permease subunit [Streptosporangiales bacterium]